MIYNTLVAKTDTGEEITFDIVAIITNKVGARNIVYYTENKVDEQGNVIVLLRGAGNGV